MLGVETGERETAVTSDPWQTHVPLPEAIVGSGITYAQGWNAVVTGKLPAKRRNGRWYVEPAAVLAFVAASDSSRA